MVTLTRPRKTTDAEHVYHAIGHVGLLTREKVAEVEEVAFILAPAQPTATPALPRKRNLLARMIRPVLSLWDELSGPAMAKREREARKLAEASFRNYTGFVGY